LAEESHSGIAADFGEILVSAAKLRFGILGAANIARKNWKAIQLSGNTTVTAVASRDLAKAQSFIDECHAEVPMEKKPRAFASYEQLLACEEVDAVYLPLPTGLRKEWVLRAAAHKKHVVCEKPCAGSVPDLEEMLEACRSNGVQFMDGVMFMHSQRLGQIRVTLDDARSVGPLRRITSAFSFGSNPEFFETNIRTHGLLEPLGCLGDLGWYCIRLTLWALNGRMPRQAIGHTHAEAQREGSPEPVPTDFSAELFFDDGVSAGFYCSFLSENQQWAIFSGALGYLQLNDFVLPFHGTGSMFEIQNTVFAPKGCDFQMTPTRRIIKVPEYSQGHPTAQEANLFRNFSNQVRSGALNAAWPEIALKTQKVTSACFESAQEGSRLVTVGS
jgi:predicted dehydrogenase